MVERGVGDRTHRRECVCSWMEGGWGCTCTCLDDYEGHVETKRSCKPGAFSACEEGLAERLGLMKAPETGLRGEAGC